VLALGVLVGVIVTRGNGREPGTVDARSTGTAGVPAGIGGPAVAAAGSPPPSASAPPSAPASAGSHSAGSPSRSPSRTPSPTATGRPNPSGANLALRKTAFASGTEGAAWPASAAVDGDPKSRWSSAFTDPQWMTVDLAGVWSLTDVRLFWERAYAVKYRVDVSLDNRHWTTVYRTSNGSGGTVDIPLNDVPARYVRMYGTRRSGQYGYSIQEFEVR
jgi:hypothetical protein